MTKLLAIDTSTERMSIALALGARVWMHEAAGGALASASLIPDIMALLAGADIGLAQLDAIAFGRGPGAFTGLRTACAVAQGLAFGAGLPVLPIDTLWAVAEDARAGRPAVRLWAAMDARMDQIYAAEYAFGQGHWTLLREPMLVDLPVLNALWADDPPQEIAGNAMDSFRGRLDTGSAQLATLAMPRAPAMLALARLQLAAGGAVAATHALPIYLRDKVAQTSAERAALHDGALVGKPVG